MSKVEKFEDLIVWQESRVLVNQIYLQFSTLKDWDTEIKYNEQLFL